MRLLILAVFFIALTACDKDTNSVKATYGDTGLPKNCRAIIQANVDSYRELYRIDPDLREAELDDIFSSLERNCGANGYSWEY